MFTFVHIFWHLSLSIRPVQKTSEKEEIPLQFETFFVRLFYVNELGILVTQANKFFEDPPL